MSRHTFVVPHGRRRKTQPERRQTPSSSLEQPGRRQPSPVVANVARVRAGARSMCGDTPTSGGAECEHRHAWNSHCCGSGIRYYRAYLQRPRRRSGGSRRRRPTTKHLCETYAPVGGKGKQSAGRRKRTPRKTREQDGAGERRRSATTYYYLLLWSLESPGLGRCRAAEASARVCLGTRSVHASHGGPVAKASGPAAALFR